MIARIEVRDNRGVNPRGFLPTIGLRFSEDVGGSGGISYEALQSDVDALAAWDCSLLVWLSTDDGATWFKGPAYAMRHEYKHKGGSRRFAFQGTALGEQWMEETALLPEYVVSTMPRGAGTERGVGWMSSAYDPEDDPDEPWDRCYDTGRSGRPPFWPSGTGAKWISASGATDETESKYFRTWLTITGSKRLVEFYLSSDESATLWCAGEKLIETSSTETGKKEYTKNTAVLFPGRYAIGVATATHVTKDGGDGVDPILVAAAILDSEGDPASWVLATNEDDWVACRRDDEPPDDVPPGPTPGQVARYLVGEAAERRVCGWENVTFDFTATTDSYGQPWPAGNFAERLFAYGSDSYFDIFGAFSESDEFDTWLTSDLVLHAAPKQGRVLPLTLTSQHFHTFATSGTPAAGTWAMARCHDGWTYRSLSGRVRREYSLELGTAITRPIGRKIIDASLRDSWRWDASGSLNPPQAGWIPYQDIKVGDAVHVSYQAIEHDVSITSLSAEAGEGGLLWDVEMTEWPLTSAAAMAAPAHTPTGVGLFKGLSA